MRLFKGHHEAVERLLWARDSRLVSRLAQSLPSARVLELADSGWCVIADAEELDEGLVARLGQGVSYGLTDVDPRLSPADRYVVALGVAVSGMGDRIGLAETPEIAKRKVLDYFFALRENHRVEFQPIVDLRTMEAHDWECLFRPEMPMLPHTISAIVEAALTAKRPVDLDMFVVDLTLARIAEIARGPAGRRMRFSINLLPASLLAAHFEANAFAGRVRALGLSPRQIIVECTEQRRGMADISRLRKQVKALRRLGFGFAIDDAGAELRDSFMMIAALEPSLIKIDREIVARVGNKDSEAKKALVEAFVSFSNKIGARVVAEGIETRRDLMALRERGVDFGQGFLLGRSSVTPRQPRRIALAPRYSVIDAGAGWESVVPKSARVERPAV